MVSDDRSKEPVTWEYNGHSIPLPKGREVFVGTEATGNQEGLLLRFINKEGEKTMLRLSYDAMDAVIQLYAQHLRAITKSESHQVDSETWVMKGDLP